MRKTAAIILSVLMAICLVAFTACNSSKDDNDSASNSDYLSSVASSSDSSGSETEDSSGQLSELPEKLTVLYQGDSITDANRSRSELTDLGNGYARMVSEALAEVYGDDIEFSFINRANSGWKLIDSWNGRSNYEEEFYKYDADIATILIGYNDIMAPTWDSSYAYVSDEQFEEAYDRLLSGLKERGTYAICIAPFYIFDHLNDYAALEFSHKTAIIARLAAKYGFGYIEVKPYLEQAVQDGAERMELIGDGSHPIYAGNRIIAGLVGDAIRKHIDKDYVSGSDVGKYERITAASDNEDDLTNLRLYVYSSLGDATYDTTTYLSGNMTSTQSVKLTNRGIESVGAYTKVCFIFNDDGKPNMTKGTLEFDVKVENALKWFSVKAHGNIWTNTSSASSEYGVNLTDTSICTPLGNGWYHVRIDLENWCGRSDKNPDVLKSVKQLVIMMSRGETAAARQAAGVDPDKESAMWIDNLLVNENEEALEISAPYTFKPAGFGIENFKDSGKALTFEYKAVEKDTNTGNEISFTLWESDWSPRITELVFIDLSSNTSSADTNGDLKADAPIGKTEDIGDGWYRFTVNCSDMPICSAQATGSETVGILYFNTVGHAFLLKNVKFANADVKKCTLTVIGGDGSGVYEQGKEATVVAVVPDGKVFAEWQIDGERVSTLRSYTFAVYDDLIITAIFVDENEAYTVTVVGGNGGGRYNAGQEATVIAIVPDGKVFSEWQVGGQKVSESPTYNFIVSGDITLTAVFSDDTHENAVLVTASKMLADFNPAVEDYAFSGKALTFEYKAYGDATTYTVQFSLWGGAGGTWSPRLTNVVTLDVVNNTITDGTKAIGKVTDLGNGWHRVTIDLSDMPINLIEGRDGTETMRKLYFNVVNHGFYLDNVKIIDSETA